MTQLDQKLSRIVEILAKASILLLLLLYLFCIFRQNKFSFGKESLHFGVGIALLLTAAAMFLSARIKSEKAAVIMIAVLSFGLYFVWNSFVKPEPISDYKVLWDGAGQIVNGTFHDRAIKKDDYFCFYNFQIGYAFYLSILYRLFKGSLAAVRIARYAVLTATNIVLYKTLRLYVSRRASFFGSMLFLMWPFIYIGSGILNNQHEALFLEALAIYIYLKNSGKNAPFYKWIVCSLILSIAIVLRPTANILLLAVIVLPVLQFILKRDRQYLICTAVMLVTYFVSSNLINEAFILSGLAPYGLKTDNLWFKLLLGLTGGNITNQPTIDAEHTDLYFDLKAFGFDYDAYKSAASSYLIDLFRSHKFSMNYLFNKVANYAGFLDNINVFLGSKDIPSDHMVIEILEYTGMTVYFVAVFFAGICCAVNKVIEKDEICLPAIAFGGYFAIYVLFEAVTRYRYEQYYLLFIMAVPAMSYVWNRIREKRQLGNGLCKF
ncbi:Dolichyl-phosphate-mannose-protein mannosyltransferase [Lachnospiraceae bacterium]|nr:Dolichyl-phosphate-mannose-protein mannosyltransferase [Lachnospiraceae bacterium]